MGCHTIVAMHETYTRKQTKYTSLILAVVFTHGCGDALLNHTFVHEHEIWKEIETARTFFDALFSGICSEI